VVCYLDDGIFDLSCAALVNKGSPFLDRLNTLIRRCLEGGVVDKYWSELIMLSLIRNKKEVPEDSNDMYFVFTISHLSTAFGVFILGHFIAFVIFLCEIISKSCCRKQIKELQVKTARTEI
jgi:hypothetical protein